MQMESKYYINNGKDYKYGKEDGVTDTFAEISWAIMRIFKRLKNHLKQNYKNDCQKTFLLTYIRAQTIECPAFELTNFSTILFEFQLKIVTGSLKRTT